MVPVPDETIPDLPPLQESENPTVETMKKTFSDALAGLTGKCLPVSSLAEAWTTFESLAKENQWEKFSSSESPLLEKFFPREYFHGNGKKKLYLGEKEGETSKEKLAGIPVSVNFPQFLIAETGTCVMLNRTAHQRLNCYLTPACVMVAFASQLRENLQSAWEGVAKQSADPATRGEYVLVTGPSRTADIERVSVLGVHGPKKLFVILIQD